MGIVNKVLNQFGYNAIKVGGKTFTGGEERTAGFMAGEVEASSQQMIESDKINEYGDFIDAYSQLPWLYAGATALAVAAVKPDLKIYREEADGTPIEIEKEKINRLIERPNDFLSYRELLQITVINMAISGNMFWNMVGTMEESEIFDGNPPAELWWMKPENIEIKGDAQNFIKYYQYNYPSGGNKRLSPSEVIHFRLSNPDSYYRGMGSLQPAKNSAILEFNAITYNKNFLANDATPLFYFKSEKQLSVEQRAAHKREWNKVHKGTKKAGNFGYCWGGMSIEKLGLPPAEAQYAEMRKMNREEILATLGVPPSVVGLLEYANYSNMEVQQRKFWEDAVIPMLDLIADKLTLRLAPLFDEDYYFKFDYSNIKALQEDEERQAKIATMLVSHGIMSPDEVAEKYYNIEPIGGAAALRYIPINWVPLNGPVDKGKIPPPEKKSLKRAEDGEKPSFWNTASRREILAKDFVRRVEMKEKPFVDQARQFLEVQAERAEKIAEKAESLVAVNFHKAFNVDDENRKYAEKFRAHYYDMFKTAGEAGLELSEGRLYFPDMRLLKREDKFVVTPELEAAMGALILESGAQINEYTLEKILALYKEAVDQNLTVVQFAKTLRDKLTELSIGRSERIARTESAKVENWGQLEGYKQSGYIEKKAWLCYFVDESRQAHMDADGNYSENPIPLDQPFNVGGDEMMYPGDGSRGARVGNIVNCLCTTMPEVRQI